MPSCSLACGSLPYNTNEDTRVPRTKKNGTFFSRMAANVLHNGVYAKSTSTVSSYRRSVSQSVSSCDTPALVILIILMHAPSKRKTAASAVQTDPCPLPAERRVRLGLQRKASTNRPRSVLGFLHLSQLLCTTPGMDGLALRVIWLGAKVIMHVTPQECTYVCIIHPIQSFSRMHSTPSVSIK
jgi:hypothetical protein